MVTQSYNDDAKLSRCKKYGDLALFTGISETKIWDLLLFKPNVALWEIFKMYLKFSSAILSYITTAFFRFRFGHNTTGLIFSMAAVSFLLTLNSNHILIPFKPFMVFISPLLVFFKDGSTLYRLIIIDIHSNSMLVFSILFCVLTIVHSVIIKAKKGNKSSTKRGESWLYIGLSKLMRINEYVVCGILEPLIVAAIGYCFWAYGDDLWFALLLCLSAFSTAMQELLDEAHHSKNQSVLDM